MLVNLCFASFLHIDREVCCLDLLPHVICPLDIRQTLNLQNVPVFKLIELKAAALIKTFYYLWESAQ